MKVAVFAETAAGETRVSAIPETVKKLTALGATVAVEAGAGRHAGVSDQDYAGAGASVGSRAEVLTGAELLLSVSGPDATALAGAARGALLVGILDPLRRRDTVSAYAAAGLEALAMEWMPRITRAQSMDVL